MKKYIFLLIIKINSKNPIIKKNNKYNAYSFETFTINVNGLQMYLKNNYMPSDKKLP